MKLRWHNGFVYHRIFIQMLDYKPCCKFVILQCITVFFTINLFLQPLLRGGSVGSSLGSYRGSSGPTVSLSSPRHYPQQFGTPLRSQGTGNKLDRTPARLGNIFFLKLYSLGSFFFAEVQTFTIKIHYVMWMRAQSQLFGPSGNPVPALTSLSGYSKLNFHFSLISNLHSSPCEFRGGAWALLSDLQKLVIKYSP